MIIIYRTVVSRCETERGWRGLEGLGLGEGGCAGKTVMVANLLQFPQKSCGCFLLLLSLLMSHIVVGVLQSTWHLCPCALPSRSELIYFLGGESGVCIFFPCRRIESPTLKPNHLLPPPPICFKPDSHLLTSSLFLLLKATQ